MAYKTLIELCKAGEDITTARAYYVPPTDGGFVVAKSPGAAALQMCKVERVEKKELLTAAFAALNEKTK